MDNGGCADLLFAFSIICFVAAIVGGYHFLWNDPEEDEDGHHDA